MNTTYLKLSCLLLATHAIAGDVLADDALVGSTKTQVIVVTGTMTEKSLEESPVPILVIDEQQIQETGAVSLDEILLQIPGVYLTDIHGQQGQEITMQGMDTKHVLVLVNGVPVSQTSGSVNVERLMLNNVERIEVVPGASSALYGSSAMGGVVNIITKQRTSSYFNADISTSQVEADTVNWPSELTANLQAGHAVGNGFVDHSLSITQYSGVDLDPAEYGDDVAGGYRWDWSENFRFNEYSIGLNWLGGLLDRPYLESKATNTYEHIKYENSHELGANIRRKTETNEQLLQIDFDSYESIQDLVSTTDSDDFSRIATSAAVRASTNWTSKIGQHQITYGAVGAGETLEQVKTESDVDLTEVPEVDRSSVELFLQDDWMTFKNFETVTGIRGQWDSDFGLFASPKIATRWDLWSGNSAEIFIRASTGIGYRVPDLKERHYVFDHSHLGYELIGNTELEPETSWATQVEVGGIIEAGFDIINWSANVFHQDVKNLIDTELDESIVNGLESYVYHNIGEAIIQGVDVSLSLPINLFEQRVTHQLSYQYLSATDKDTDESLAGRPEYTVKLTQRIPFNGRLKPVLTNQLQIQGEQVIDADTQEKGDGYTTLNTSAQLSLSDEWTLLLSINNLTDQYNSNEASDVRPTVGRTWKMTLSYQSQ